MKAVIHVDILKDVCQNHKRHEVLQIPRLCFSGKTDEGSKILSFPFELFYTCEEHKVNTRIKNKLVVLK